MKNRDRIMSVITVVLIVAQLLLVLLSWIIAAALPSAPIRSLLNDGGVRHMFYSFTDSLMSPVVIWILLYSMVYGIWRGSRLSSLDVSNLTFRKRLAMRTIIFETVIYIAIMLIFTVIPHAILLSVTGSLITLDFFNGLIPNIALFLAIIFITYGSITRNFSSVSSVLHSISDGISSSSFIWTPYILFMLFMHSVIYVFF